MQTARMLWMSLTVSVLLLGVVAFVAPPQDNAPQMPMLVIFAVVAVGEAIASFIVPANMMRTGFKTLEVETTEEPVANDDSAMFRTEPRMQKVIKNPKKALRVARARYQTPLILGLALSEAVAINGVILSQLGFSMAVFLPFLVVGLVLVAIRFPSDERLVAALEAGTGARLPTKR